jgi:2-keto-4-pentenoate hydratase/2-oxohepta-3-ene-1,7-dioic acid hydratase in catechol pathway
MKIICVGWNYPDHNTEMKHESVGEPLIFMKPDSALLRENKPFFIPDFSKQVEYEVELVVRINRLGKNISEKFASRYYEEVALGIDFTARDLQQRQRALGAPWEIAKAFDNSAVISDFIPLSTLANAEGISFSLSKNGVEVQRGNTRDMLFSVNQIIAYVSQFFTLKIGDLIYTGTPAGVGPVVIGDYLEGFIEGNKMLNFFVK